MFDSGIFWATLLATAALSRALGPGRHRLRATLLAAASLVVLATVLQLPPLLLAALGAIPLWLQLGLRLTRGLAARRPFLAAFAVFLPVLVPWVLGKEALARGLAPLDLLHFVGYSFLLVKCWTYIKDSIDGRIRDATPGTVLAYLVHFPTYTAGPMHLYGEFEASLKSPRPLDAAGWVDVVFRTLLGLTKVKLLAPLLTPLSLTAIREAGQLSPATLVLGALAYSLVIWLDFSGYSDIAIALSRGMGVETPENFANPYFSKNIRVFWQRWHITFSRILTAYVFVPLSRALTTKTRVGPRTVMVAAYLGTFCFCGYWHGPTPGFVLWGLWHAAGLIVYDLYRQAALKRRLHRARAGGTAGGAAAGAAAPRWRSKARDAAAVGLTFVFVSLGWIFFALPIGLLLEMR